MNYHIEIIKSSRYCYINAISDDTNERLGKVCIDLQSEDINRYSKAYTGNFAKIILISTVPSACGNGIATTLLNKTIKEFKNYNLYLNVVPLPRENENIKYCSKKGLSNFYHKFGFEKYLDDICVTTMIRKMI